jgi:hypothetical protein
VKHLDILALWRVEGAEYSLFGYSQKTAKRWIAPDIVKKSRQIPATQARAMAPKTAKAFSILRSSAGF